jgi:hypothetical protein
MSESESVRSTEEDASDDGMEFEDLTVLIGDDDSTEVPGPDEARLTSVLMAGLAI